MRCRRNIFFQVPGTLFTLVFLLTALLYLHFVRICYSQESTSAKISAAIQTILNPRQHQPAIPEINLPTYAARLPAGWVSELGISPKEEVWVATSSGNTYYTKSVEELWHCGPFRNKEPFYSAYSGNFERVNFFSEDTLMISGSIEGMYDDSNYIYWSGDHGKNWRKIKIGDSNRIDAAYVNNKGKAWLGGSSQRIYYSADWGLTWEQKNIVAPYHILWFSTIYFADDEQTGLIGSNDNTIFRTKNNCKTWQELPTPLAQGKYKTLSKEIQPVIKKIRFLGNYYLVNQQEKIFYTSQEKINWQPLPDVIDFEVTTKGLVYFVHRNLTVSLANSQLTTLWQTAEKLSNAPAATAVRNNKLFVYTPKMIYKIDKSSFKSPPLLTTEIPIAEPYLQVKIKGAEIGFHQNDVLHLDKKKNQWYRSQMLPFAVGNAVIFNEQLIIADTDLKNRYTLNPINDQIEKYDLPSSLFNLTHNRIKSFSMEQGSQGCFHSEKNLKNYVRKGDIFVLDQNTKLKDVLTNIPSQIPVHRLNYLLNTVIKYRNNMFRVADLEITLKDVSSFVILINEKEKKIKEKGIELYTFQNYYRFPGENSDFNFYRQVARSINRIPDAVVNKIFSTGSGSLGTTTNWIKLTFTFQDGRVLTLSNSDSNPNYFHTPWKIDFEGLLLKSNSVEIGRQIDALTGGTFFNPYAKDKQYALFQIADYLYRESLQQ